MHMNIFATSNHQNPSLNFLHKCPSRNSSHSWLALSLTLGVAVEDETVGSAAGDAGDDVGGSQLDDAVAESL